MPCELSEHYYCKLFTNGPFYDSTEFGEIFKFQNRNDFPILPSVIDVKNEATIFFNFRLNLRVNSGI